MAILARMPQKSIIRGFRGAVDFYAYGTCWGKPIFCARAWPKFNPAHLHPNSKAQTISFTYIAKATTTLPENIRQAYAEMAGGTILTWKDMAIRCYYNSERV